MMADGQIKTMLEEEMQKSREFSAKNFGLAVGDDFREMVEDAAQSQQITAHLMMGHLMNGLMGQKIGEWMKANPPLNQKDETFMCRAVMDNFETFKVPMEFLYWGIQIGRKMERQESEVLKKLIQ